MMDIRPRREYLWTFGVCVFIVVGIVALNYNGFYEPQLPSFVMPMAGRDTTKTSQGDYPISTQSATKGAGDGNRRNKETNEVHNFVFVKVHKAASSAIQNIMLRFAMSRKLNVLFPEDGHLINEFSYHIKKKKMVELPRGEHFNILCNHVIFNKKEVSKFLPNNNTVYLGVLRYPLDQVTSALYYFAQRYDKSRYSLAFKTDPNNPLRAYLSQPKLYDRDPPKKSFVNNRMSIDLGFPVYRSFENDKHSQQKISQFIENLDNTFQLILIVELFDESLILLRRLLHWETGDMVYLKLNVNSQREHTGKQTGIKRLEESLHEKWAPIDYAIYRHFRAKMEKTILELAEDFQRELKHFRSIEERVTTFCDYATHESQTLFVGGSEWGKEFSVTKDQCVLMHTGEPYMVSKAKKAQNKRHGFIN